MTANTSIFEYQNPRQFLLDRLEREQKLNPDFSVRKLAYRMGLKSHGLLVMLLQGKRPFRVKHANYLAKGFNLGPQERLYLQALIQFDAAQDEDEKQLCQLLLSDLHPGGGFRTKEIEEFILISHWIHMAILTATRTKHILKTADDVHALYRKKATIHEVRAAVERLLDLGFLKRAADGRLEPTYQSFTTKSDITNQGARKYFAQTMDLAHEAIEQVPLDRREFHAFSVAVPSDKVMLAKEMMRKFRSQFVRAMGPEPGDDVYQVNLQFFQLTESPAATTAEDEGVETKTQTPNPKEVEV